mmetsp:Transcript_26209/g.71955  ORF Transcript_26209/g.71955 Transcript_26209/m.71955 type:complete len:262 (+) Transcript_26209:794-1579(+)
MGTQLWIIGDGHQALQELLELRPQPISQRLSRPLRQKGQLRLCIARCRTRSVALLGRRQHETQAATPDPQLVPDRRRYLLLDLWLPRPEPSPDVGAGRRPPGILPGSQRGHPRLPQEAGQEAAGGPIGEAPRTKGRAQATKEEKEQFTERRPKVLPQPEPQRWGPPHRAGTDAQHRLHRGLECVRLARVEHVLKQPNQSIQTDKQNIRVVDYWEERVARRKRGTNSHGPNLPYCSVLFSIHRRRGSCHLTKYILHDLIFHK